MLNRFDLSLKEKRIVIKIIKYHGETHRILDQDNKNLKKEFSEFKSKFSDVFLELILLAMADTLASNLKLNNPKGFNFRIKSYNKIINSYSH